MHVAGYEPALSVTLHKLWGIVLPSYILYESALSNSEKDNMQ